MAEHRRGFPFCFSLITAKSQAMKLASTTHANATRFPSTLLKSSSATTARFRFALRRSYPFLPAGCVCGRNVSYCSTSVFARRTEREQEASVPSKELTRSRSHDGIDDNDSSCNDSSTSNSGEVNLSMADYSSSLRTVALCVFSAVVFGTGLGFKDGVSKASEFFTGYLLEQSLSVDNLFVFVLIFNYFKVPLDYQATPLLLTVAVIELSDIAFAVDSIPAVFGVTRDPFIVYTSNLFAILGLRSYYTLISAKMAELEYLQPAIGVILGFVGCKMILDFFGFHIPTEVSLGFVAVSLGTGVSLSLLKKSDETG